MYAQVSSMTWAVVSLGCSHWTRIILVERKQACAPAQPSLPRSSTAFPETGTAVFVETPRSQLVYPKRDYSSRIQLSLRTRHAARRVILSTIHRISCHLAHNTCTTYSPRQLHERGRVVERAGGAQATACLHTHLTVGKGECPRRRGPEGCGMRAS